MNADGLRTLVLSHRYEPIKVVSWQKAISLLTLGKIEVIEEYDDKVRSVSLVLRVPSVVRLLSVFKKNKKKIRFSRTNIFARDRYRCQYCGKTGTIHELTHDHVLPRSQGGKTEWTNIVTACNDCNCKKRNRTPSEAGMKLMSKPIHPTWVPVVTIHINHASSPDSWASYLYWNRDLTE